MGSARDGATNRGPDSGENLSRHRVKLAVAAEQTSAEDGPLPLESRGHPARLFDEDLKRRHVPRVNDGIDGQLTAPFSNQYVLIEISKTALPPGLSQ